jgi:chromosomal replication initiation ATPase DnaA
MQVDVELLPAINHIIFNTEQLLKRVIGTDVRLKIRILNDEVNEAFLQTLVCEEFNVTWAELISKSRKQEPGGCKAVCIGGFAGNIPATLKKLAAILKRDHTTVLHGTKRSMTSLIAKDNVILPKLKAIERNINA